MIVVDTDVVSELMRSAPAASVATWARNQPAAEVYVTAITLAEVGYGVERLPAGRRKDQLRATGRGVFARFSEHVLAFDAEAARLYPAIVSRRERIGAPIAGFDAQIASICLHRAATLATRNVEDFEHTDIDVINPWDAAS